MSGDQSNRDLVRHLPTAPKHRAINACTINIHQETDVSIKTDATSRGLVTKQPDIPLRDSSKPDTPRTDSSKSVKTSENEKINNRIPFSIDAILSNHDITGIIYLPKAKNAYPEAHKKRTLTEISKLESLVNYNTGQMSRATIRAISPKLASNFTKTGSSSVSVTQQRENYDEPRKDVSKNVLKPRAAPPGFEMAAATATANVATGVTLVMPPGFTATAEAAAINAATGVKRTVARKDDRIGIDHYPTTTIHYGRPQPTPHQAYAALPQPLQQGEAAPPQLLPSQQWYIKPPSSLRFRGSETIPSIADAAPTPPLGIANAAPTPPLGRANVAPTPPLVIDEQNEHTEIIVGYKTTKGQTGHRLPITMDAKLCVRQLPTIKKGANVIADNKIAKRPSTAPTPDLVGP